MKIDRLLLHSSTKAQAKAFISDPSHALVITGGAGSGKIALAKSIASDILKTGNLNSYPYFWHYTRTEGKQELSIEQVKEIISSLKTKVPGRRPIRRAVLIESIQNMSREGQNALLKSLEEPSGETLFILTSETKNQLPPTIISRAQTINIFPISTDKAIKYFEKNHQSSEIINAWNLSSGRAGLMMTLLETDSEHPLRNAIDEAKKFISMDRYNRLVFLDKNIKDRDGFRLFLEGFSRIIVSLSHSAITHGRHGQSKKLLKSRQLTSDTQNFLEQNANVRLSILGFVLKLPI